MVELLPRHAPKLGILNLLFPENTPKPEEAISSAMSLRI